MLANMINCNYHDDLFVKCNKCNKVIDYYFVIDSNSKHVCKRCCRIMIHKFNKLNSEKITFPCGIYKPCLGNHTDRVVPWVYVSDMTDFADCFKYHEGD